MLPTVALLGALIVTATELVLAVADVEAAFDMFTSNEFELDVEALLLTVTAPWLLIDDVAELPEIDG